MATGFNGATFIRTWKPSPSIMPSLAELAASMEPRSYERGNVALRASDRATMHALQWSHVHTNVETLAVRSRRPYLRLIASMEPRSYERGNGHAYVASRIAVHAASMEPRSYERGNGATDASRAARPASLQWSHVHTNVETHAVASARRCQSYCASMEPRSYERGNAAAAASQSRSRRCASMEPRSYERGNRTSSDLQPVRGMARFNGATFIRTWKRHRWWRSVDRTGHRASMEPRSYERGNARPISVTALRHAAIVLQWSHVHTNVETGRMPTCDAGLRPASFNGATFIRTWKPGESWRMDASMEPRSYERGNCPTMSSEASMEPRSYERGNSPPAKIPESSTYKTICERSWLRLA